MSAPPALAAWLDQLRPTIDAELDRRLPRPATETAPEDRLLAAMRYAALGEGKRLRPAMAVAACEAVGGARDRALPAAAAVELLHAYTLVHDDLPALDDDDLRRGRPTVHKQYDEATAILVGDALQTSAFGALADLGAGAADAVRILAARAGAAQLIGGQAIDLAVEGSPGFERLELLHTHKTGALFSAAAELGAIAGGAGAEDRQRLSRYGMAVGIAFQFADDRDDAEFREHAARAHARTEALIAEAAAIADHYGSAPLADIARWIGSRV